VRYALDNLTIKNTIVNGSAVLRAGIDTPSRQWGEGDAMSESKPSKPRTFSFVYNPQPQNGSPKAPSPYYPEVLAQTGTSPANLHQLAPPCRSWGHMGTCEAEGHTVAHELICNREWCSSELCGGINGAAHQRRKAKWYPKARQMEIIGRFVITLPVELRKNYRTKATLGRLGIAFKRMFQRHGFERGLRRWHFFGEDHKDFISSGEAPRYHPHIETLVDGRYMSKTDLDAVKDSVGAILGIERGKVNMHYQYAHRRDTGRKCHFISYALRPTFANWEWDEELAHEFIGFRNAMGWGKWEGEPVWDMPKDSDGPDMPSRELMAIQAGYCPLDGSRISWTSEILRLNQVINPDDWIQVDGGYYIRGSPS